MSPGQQGTKRANSRAQLLAAARRELVKGQGYLEVANVARRAGVSEGVVYYHFGNKAGLLNSIVSDFYAALDEQFSLARFQGRTWADREKARVYAWIEYFYREPAAIFIATRVRTDPAFAADEAARSARLSELGARNIAEAQRDGEIAACRDPHLLVSMILAGVTAGVLAALNADPRMPLDSAQREIWSFVAQAAGLERQAG